ncbi:MAG: hypothetical protein KAR19_19365 [Bacteroidales bacterium]|nr:hypothetical protein [Bacteroidales bacterium]
MNFKKSGMSARAFYRQHNLPERIFYYWRRKYREAHGLSAENGFVPVEIGSPVLPSVDETRGIVQIQYPNGVLVTVNKSVSISGIKALIKAI